MIIEQSCMDDLIRIVKEARTTWEVYEMHNATLELVRAFHNHHQNMPTIRELGIMIDILEGKPLGKTGTNTANRRLNVLEARGDLVREPSCFSGDKRVRMKFPQRG